jgi:ketosteroid isomerase-like protein
MSRENVEVVRKGIEAVNHQDAEGMAALCVDDMEFVSALAAQFGGGAYRGKDAFADYFTDMRQTWEEWRIEGAQFFDLDPDRVAAVFRIVGKGKGSGTPVEHPIGMVWDLRNGKLWRGRSYLDPGKPSKPWGYGSRGPWDSACGRPLG